MVATAASEAVTKASQSARATAVKSIDAARDEAKSIVLSARQKYVSSLVDAHAKIALMKTAERRFKTLMRIFAKARAYAGASILGVKKCRRALAEAKSKRTSYDDYTRVYNTAVATAKTRVGKMKVVEKRVFLMAKALAKARSEAFACKLKVRKMGYSCAKTCAVASEKIRDAISAATTSISQAIDLATATASVKAESILEAASQSKAKSEADLQSAKLAVAEAKAQVEAVSGGQAPAATSSDEDDSLTRMGDDGNSGYPTDLASLSGAPAISNAQVAAQSSVTSGAGTDATDTKAYY
ncbi:hypothetical protein ElyMa_002993000 [Elysia marginata]|uniref:Uncharacterized protein n=1 Tax=Elysia marginata TaxID=1093978 RepID=A0AAV4IAW6_9GAST|nr:hypothetical protein ElyMa_002993000 [Elysia marginata]